MEQIYEVPAMEIIEVDEDIICSSVCVANVCVTQLPILFTAGC